MIVKQLTVKNFRNYSSAKAEFSSLLNIVEGQNAAGKTNLIEAVYLAGLLRSPRTPREKELIKSGAPAAYISVIVEKKFRTHKIDIQIDAAGKKRVLLDGLPILRNGELLGALNVVFFSPDEMKLVKEAPEFRRKFLDIALSQQQKVYFYALSRYGKILKQRNNLLKNSSFSRSLDDMLDVWDAQLAQYGAIIIQKRIEFIEKLQRYSEKIHFDMSGGKEKMCVRYDTEEEITSFFENSQKNAQNLENSLKIDEKNAKNLNFEEKTSANNIEKKQGKNSDENETNSAEKQVFKNGENDENLQNLNEREEDFAKSIEISDENYENLLNSNLKGNNCGELLQNKNENDSKNGDIIGDLSKSLLKNFKTSREKDKKLLYTTFGPHRDDMKITINGDDVRKFSSQGQQRTTALALKIGETGLFLEETGEQPVLLLDDVFSELDENRQKLLLRSTSDAQVILTATEYGLNYSAGIIKISNGRISKQYKV